MLEVTNDSFKEEVSDSENAVVIDFWAPWCGPCKYMTPVFESVSNTIDNVKFVKVNVDNNPEIASKFNVMGIPTIIMVKNDEVLFKSVGLLSEEKLENLIKNSLK